MENEIKATSGSGFLMTRDSIKVSSTALNLRILRDF